MKINYSEKFMDKFIGTTFNNITERGFLRTLYWYVIDSKERTRVRLDAFLKEQLIDERYIKDTLKLVANELKKKDPDQTIINILKYVYNRVEYGTDISNFKKIEYWADAYETWKRRRDDCDGINALIYILARLAGISNLILWSAIGDVKGGGHYWLLYFSTNTDKWYAIDGTYKVNLSSISKRTPFKFSQEKYIKTWFIFNDDYIFKQR